MAKSEESNRFEQLLRARPWLLWLVWGTLCVGTGYSLLLAGYAAPTLYEGF